MSLGLVAVIGGGMSADTAVARTGGQQAAGEEVPRLRTAFSQTRQLPGGVYETTLSSRPVNAKDGRGVWRPVDDALVRSADGSLVDRASSIDVEIPATATGDIRFADGGDAVTFSLVDADPRPVETDDGAARFEAAVDDVDVEYEVDGSALKETLTLASADAPATFRFDVDAGDLRAHVAPSGDIVFLDAAGARQLGFAAPWMRDADGVVSRRASYEVERVGGGTQIVLRLDREWLDSSARTFPVVVDPTVYAGLEHLCEIRNGSRSNTTYCDGAVSDWWVGRDASGIVHRTMFQLDDLRQAVPDYTQVLDSWFAVYLNGQNPVEPSDIDLHRMTRGFAPGATWNRADGRALWTRPGGDFAPLRMQRASTADAASDGWMAFDMTPLARGLVAGTEPNADLLLKAGDETRTHVDSFNYAEVKVRWTHRTGISPLYTYERRTLTDGSTLSMNMASGNLTLVSDDLELESDDGRFTVGRFFNSHNLPNEEEGTFGPGSRGDFGSITLEHQWLNGSYVFAGPGAETGVFDKRSDGTFDSPAGMNAVLTELPGGGTTITFNDTTEVWTFDGDGRLTQTRQDDGYTIDGTYGTHGLATLRDSTGKTATFAYDGAGNLRTITDQASAVHRYEYDLVGRLASYTSPVGAQTRYTHDGYNRLTRISLPDGTALRIAYHGAGYTPYSITPVNALGVDQTATRYSGELDWTEVTRPAYPRLVYFFDPTSLIVDLRQTGDDAAISASGEIPALHDRWIEGDEPLSVNVSAAQARAGIQLTGLEVDDVVVDSVGAAPCDWRTCPVRARERLTYDLTLDGEGRYEYRVTTTDGDDRVTNGPLWDIKIDRSPPTGALSGSLHEARSLHDGEDSATLTGDSELVVEAADRWSGVASVEMLVDGQRVDPAHLLRTACSSSACPPSATATFTLAHASMAEGDHTIAVVVRDQLAPPSATSSSPHVYVEDFVVHAVPPPTEEVPVDEIDDDTPPGTAAPGAEPGGWEPPEFAGGGLFGPLGFGVTPQEIAVEAIADDATRPASDVATMLAGSGYTVDTAAEMTFGTEADGVTPRVIGAVVELALDAPHAIRATIGCVQSNTAQSVRYDARVAASDVRDLLVRVDTRTGEVLCAAPGTESQVELFEPAPNQPQLPRLED